MINAAARANALSIIANLEADTSLDGYASWGVTREGLAGQLRDRLSGAADSWPNQGGTSLCGPAAFMFCLLNDRPDLYVQHIIDLWSGRSATLGQRSVRVNGTVQANARATVQRNGVDTNLLEANRVSAVDWISMASLRNDSPDLNPIADYDHPTDKLSAITRPKYLKGWFGAVGATTLLDNTSEIISTAGWDELVELAFYAESGWVVMLVAAAMLQRGGGFTNKNHWVVLNGPIYVNGHPITSFTKANKPDLDSAKIQARIFSWGNESESLRQQSYLPELNHFLKCFHGGIAFSSIP